MSLSFNCVPLLVPKLLTKNLKPVWKHPPPSPYRAKLEVQKNTYLALIIQIM